MRCWQRRKTKDSGGWELQSHEEEILLRKLLLDLKTAVGVVEEALTDWELGRAD